MKMSHRIRLIFIAFLSILIISSKDNSKEPAKISIQKVAGLSNSVEIHRDSWGIPTIKASNSRDLFFGFGYAMASDRLWQMDGMRRLASGRIAEIAGSAQLHWDTYHLTLGLRRIADETALILDSETRDFLQAFADGVNAYISQCTDLPFEFMLLGYRPEVWTISDSLVIEELVAAWLSGDSNEEEMYQSLVDFEGENKSSLLFRPVPEFETTYNLYANSNGERSINTCREETLCISREKPVFKRFDLSVKQTKNNATDAVSSWFSTLRDITKFRGLKASNIWAVDGSLTESGEPILAMDPHLNYFAPSVLYEVRLESPEFKCWGATFPGMPVLPFGANEYICWGASNFPADCQDLYIEKVNPLNRMEYKVDDSWVPFEVIHERIPSKTARGIEYYTLDIYKTRRGPVVSFHYNDYFALRWTGSEPSNDVSSFFDVMRARSIEDFYEAFRTYSCPPENFCVAEAGKNGRVAQVLVGKIPIRKGYDGSKPVPGYDSSYDWSGYIPYDDLPHRLDPPEGFVVHANNLPINGMKEGKRLLGTSFSTNHRVDRIAETLIQNAPLTHEEMRIIQMDVLDTSARLFVPALLNSWNRLDYEYAHLAEYINLLKDWNYCLEENSIPATIYQIWLIEFANLCIIENLSASSSDYLAFQDRWLPLLEEYVNGNSTLPWLKNDAEDIRDRNLLDSFDLAINKLKNKIGTDINEWAWGKVHLAVFPHPSGMSGFIGAGSHPWGGGHLTVRVGHFDVMSDPPFQNDFGAVFRAVASSINAKWHITAVLPPGEGGSALRPHFSDQMQMWLTNTQREVPFGGISFPLERKLKLEPAG